MILPNPNNKQFQQGLFFSSILLVALVFSAGLNGPFFADDNPYLLQNPFLQQLPPSEIWRLFTQLNNIEYLPLRDLSFYIDYQLFADNPLGYKIHNLVLYLLLFVVTFFTSRALLALLHEEKAHHFGLALLISLLFALHPVHVESVSWISGRKDLLSALFSMAALWCFSRALTQPRPGYLIAVSSLLLILALLSKSVVMPVALIMLLIAMMHFQRSQLFFEALKRAVLISLPLLLIAVIMTGIHSEIATISHVRLDVELLGLERQPVLELLYILGKLSAMALLPYDLSLLYQVMPFFEVNYSLLILATAMLLLAFIGLIYSLKYRSILGLGLVVFLLFIAPFLQLMPFKTWSLASDRFLMLAIYGLAIAFALLLYKLPLRVMLMASVLICTTYAGLSWQRGTDWQNSQVLINSAVKSQPQKSRAVIMKALMVDMAKGDFVQANSTLNTLQDDYFRPAAIHLLNFYQYYGEAIKQNDAVKMNQAAQQLSMMHSVLLESKKRPLTLRTLGTTTLLGEQLGNGYMMYLKVDNNAQAHYNYALSLLEFNPGGSDTRARHHLQQALSIGLPASIAERAQLKLQGL